MRKTLGFIIGLFLAVTVIIAVSMRGGSGGENVVRVYCYGDYMDPAVIKTFEKETGIKVVLDTFDTSEEMYPVIKNHAGVYDVICPSDYMIERMGKEGLLAEIDESKIPNLKNIDDVYMEMSDRSFDPGNRYAVPYQWGTCGIMYNTKKIKRGDVTSWADLWKKKYAGKIIMQDSVRDTLMVGLKLKGNSLNSTEENALAEAVKVLKAQKPLVYKYANDSARDLLIGNSADLGVVWNGEVIYSQELNKNLDFVVPEEGSQVFIDGWCIPQNAENKENAEKWIDFMCRGDIAYKNYEYLTYSTPNRVAREKMSDDERNNPALFPPKKILERCEVLRDLGPEADAMYSKYWKQFKLD